MVFSSPLFLFLFLPILVILFWLLPLRFRNRLLVCASLSFYAWGEPVGVLWLLVSICVNYLVGLKIAGVSTSSRTRWLLLGVGANLLMLGYFKYLNFIVEQINVLIGWTALPPIQHELVLLPLGISFFTFQAISYLIDLSRGEVQAQKNPFKLALFISLFPQLIAGPIVRYSEIEQQIQQPSWNLSQFAFGWQRIIWGLSKKVLIADVLGRTADTLFSTAPETLSTDCAWLGIVCYSLQIFYDFSGYSDMAIGLGAMFGFSFPENFNAPYRADSIREFWRRWHMTLSRWFRDYVYIPLGGNQQTKFKTARNLVLVFALCGWWHGASWNFLVWGLFHGLFLAMERCWSFSFQFPQFIRHCYVCFVVMVGWVFFRSSTLTAACSYLNVLCGNWWDSSTFPIEPSNSMALYTYPLLWIVLCVGVLGLLPLKEWTERLSVSLRLKVPQGLVLTGHVLLLLLVMMFIASSTYSPFIYFRF